MWPDIQTHFARSLYDPELAPPTDTHGFNVYRNNVAVSLKTALGETFPVVKSLVGEEFFNAMAGVFWRSSPPTSPVLAEWGKDFPTFLQTFEPAQTLPFLADVAHLEWAWLRAYHALDASPVGVEILSQLSENDFDTNYLSLHPSLSLISSPWPIVSIWNAHQGKTGEADLGNLPDYGETAVVLRPKLDVFVTSVDEAETAFIQSCLEKRSLSHALEMISNTNNPAITLANLFQRGGVVTIEAIDL